MKRLVMIAVLLAFVWPVVSQAQCPPGSCPAPGYEQQQGGPFGGGNWGTWSPPKSGDWQAKPPEYACHVHNASGSLIYKDANEGAVLTAYHVVQGGSPDNIPIRFPDGTSYKGNIYRSPEGKLAIDKAFDLVLIKIPAPQAKPCEMASDWPKKGEYVSAAGYDQGRTYRVRPGQLVTYKTAGYAAPAPTTSTMEISVEAQGGQSGGPMLNSRGELCGVVSRSSHRDPRSRAWTWGAAITRIGALCSQPRMLYPWQRPQWRGDVEESIGQLQQGVEEAKRLPLPGPVPLPLPQSTDLAERLARVEAQVEAIAA